MFRNKPVWQEILTTTPETCVAFFRRVIEDKVCPKIIYKFRIIGPSLPAADVMACSGLWPAGVQGCHAEEKGLVISPCRLWEFSLLIL